MNSNNLAALVLATGLWIGLAAWAMGGGPNGEFWTSTSSAKVASHPTLVRGSYPRQARAVSPVYRRDRDSLTKDLRPCRFGQGRSRDDEEGSTSPLLQCAVWEERSGAAAGLAPQPPQHDALGAV